jgi:hypothetical protein
MKGENTMKTKNKSNKNQTSEIPTTGRIGANSYYRSRKLQIFNSHLGI